MSDEPKKLHLTAEDGRVTIPDGTLGSFDAVRITVPMSLETWSAAPLPHGTRQERPDLLPCPFCGAVAVSGSRGGRDFDGEPWGYVSVECSRCAMVGFEGDDELQDVEVLWQRRHHE